MVLVRRLPADGRVGFGLVSLCALIGTLLVASAPALAAAPEEPETGKAEAITNTAAILHGTINPASKATVSWFFEYKEGSECTGGHTTPVQGPAEVEAEATQATVSALQPGTQYTFCLAAQDEASEVTVGSPETFTTTTTMPTIAEETASKVNSSEATVTAQINPGGMPATYRVEYGTSEPYSSSGEASLPAAESAVSVLAHLTGLKQGTEYRFRFVAHSVFGTNTGGPIFFITGLSQSASASAPPDGRRYEWVSDSPGNQEVYAPQVTLENELGFKQDVFTERPFRASADGGSVAFVDEPAPTGGGTGNQGQSFGDEWLARRTPDGWAGADIQPPLTKSGTEFQAFSNDLTQGYINSAKADRLAPSGIENCRNLYMRDSANGAYLSLVTETQTPGFCGTEHEPVFAAASSDGSRIFFQTPAVLTPGSSEAPGGGSVNLYESHAGTLRQVNVLPSGQPAPTATFGSPSSAEPERSFDFSNVASNDGNVAFWTDLSTGILYLREDGARTVQVSAGTGAAQYWTASVDGRYAFYIEGGKLFRFNRDSFLASTGSEPEALESAREELVGEGLAHENADVRGVLGVSDDGSDVYLVAGAVLATNVDAQAEKASQQTCRQPTEPQENNQEENLGNLEGGGCNLYLLHVGEGERFIATLAPKDNDLPVNSGGGQRIVGDWRPELGSRAAEVAPDGNHLVFESRQRLTGYNNGGTKNEEFPSLASEPEVEVFVYDAGTSRLSCASCAPTGTPPTVFAERHGASTNVPPSLANAFMRRWMSTDGSRVFFNTSQPLAPQDTNGAQDVYEWERNGTGSCTQSAGCVYLISGGSSSDNSFFVDASASGGDVFFAARAELAPGAGDQKMQLYDAHECRSSAPCPEATSLACTGTGCQGVPPAPPLFATPASATFAGAGNFLPPSVTTGKYTKTAAQVRRETLSRALRACRAKRSKHRRAVCEAHARRRYGTPSRAKNSNKSGKRRARR